MTTPEQRLAQARRAGIAWFIAAILAIVAQMALEFALHDDNPIGGLFKGVWAICVIFGFEYLGWQRGYRAGRAEQRAQDSTDRADEPTTGAT